MSKAEVIDHLVDVYRSLMRYPSILCGRILKTDSKIQTIPVLTKWTQRNLEKKEISKFQRIFMVNISNHDHMCCPPVDVSTEQLSSFSESEKYCCILREGVSNKESGGKKKQYLEIWANNSLYKNFDIDEFDVHGPIYYDVTFRSLEWSPDETKVLYIAEKKPPKTEPFYKQKTVDPKPKPDDTVLRGEEYAYKSDWGEQLMEKYQPVIGICDVKHETLSVLQGVPANFSPGQVIWSKKGDGIYGIALQNEPRKLGLIYCSNRKGYVFYLSLKGDFKILSQDNKSVRSPRLSHDGKYLFWLQRSSQGPHDGCQELVRYDTTTKKIEIIIPIVKQPSKFCGLFTHELPKRCFSNDGRKIFFSTLNKTKILSYCLNLDMLTIQHIVTEGSSTVLDVYNDMILISTSSLQSTPSISLSKTIDSVQWIPLTKPTNLLPDSVVKEMEFNAPTDDSFKYFNALYFGPRSGPDKSVPLIVYPHGGPHSAVPDVFQTEGAFFVSLGFAVLYVNYRGSTGVGQDGVEFLPGKIGDTDVKDNQLAVSQILKDLPFLDENKMVLFGGSHGGFLVAQLSAQYPDMYKAVVSRNPVIDVCSMYGVTDIPDWNSIESGFPYSGTVPLTLEQTNMMYNVSPLKIADKIKVPFFVMLGKKDMRVPMSQGMSLYHLLKSRNVKTKLNVYDDNHALSQVPIHLDSLINATLWFMEHTKFTPLEFK